MKHSVKWRKHNIDRWFNADKMSYRPLNLDSCSRGFSIMEYLIVLVVIVAAFVVSGQYIQNGLQGQFRKAGESFAYLRQHDPEKTRDCIWDDRLKLWYSEKCFDYYMQNSPPSAADDQTSTWCLDNFTMAICAGGTGSGGYLARCPTTCEKFNIKTQNCWGPCGLLADPSIYLNP